MTQVPQKHRDHPVKERLRKERIPPEPVESPPEEGTPTAWDRFCAGARSYIDEIVKGRAGWGASFLFHAALLLCLYGIIIGLKPRPEPISINTMMSEEAGEEEFDSVLDETSLTPLDQEQAENSTMLLEQDVLFSESDLLIPSGDADASNVDLLAGDNAGGRAGFFGAAATGNSFVFIVDSSGSMTGQRFERAKVELRRSIERLEPGQTFHVVFFNSETIPMFEPGKRAGMIRPTAKNRTMVRQWIEMQNPGSTTNPEGAIRLALQLKPAAIFLLSDGEFDDPEIARAAALEENKSQTVIHTIAFISREGEETLRYIANDHGGTYRFVD